MIEVKWVGNSPDDVADSILPELEKVLSVVAENTIAVVRKGVIDRTPVGDPDTDPHSGQLKRSWGEVERTAEGFSFSTGISYAAILELGLYKRVGPRTVAYEGGIYSSQAPGGIVRPIVTDRDLIIQIVSSVLQAMGLMRRKRRGRA